jgi:Zn-finger nucleic acid-binding protein
MTCPNKHGELEKALFHNVEVDYCAECLGIFFDQDELQWAKDDADKHINWIDIDMWRDGARLGVVKLDKLCPRCRIPMVEVNYDKSSIKLDFCKHCKGIWLDRGEFKQMMVYMKKKADYEVLHHYTKNLVHKLWEVFSGPKAFREDLAEFLMLIKLFAYKFEVQHPVIERLIEDLPK